MSRKRPAPEGILLHKLEWDFFVTLTHAPCVPGQGFSQPTARTQDRRWSVWVNEILKRLKIRRDGIRWIKRTEVGKGGRDHFHALINFHKRKLANKATMHFLSGVWLQLGYGWANCRSYGSHGVSEYITKLQNEYEMNRFGSERYRHVEFSKSTMKTLRRLTRNDAIHTG